MRWSALWSVVAALAAADAAAAQSGPVVLAILPFEDRGSYGQDKEVFRALALEIPATLAGELRRHPRVRLVDPARLRQAVQAQDLGADARVDAATAAKIGGQVGARYAITGNFADFYGKFRIDARVIDVESGQILKIVSNNDPNLQDRADLSRIIHALADKIVGAIGLSPSAPGGRGARIPSSATSLGSAARGLLPHPDGREGRGR